MKRLVLVVLVACSSKTERAPVVGHTVPEPSAAPTPAPPRVVRMPASSMAPTLDIGAIVTLAPRPAAITRGSIIAFRHPCVDREYLKRVIAVGGDTIEVRCGVVHLNGAPLPQTPVPGECVVNDKDLDGNPWQQACTRYRETLGGVAYDVLGPVTEDMKPKSDFPISDVPTCPDEDSRPRLAIVRTAKETGACQRQAHVVIPKDSYFVLGDHRSNSNDSRHWGVVPDALVTGVRVP